MNSGPDLQPVASPDRVLVLASDVSLFEAVQSALTPAQFQVRQASHMMIFTTLLSEWPASVAIVDLDASEVELMEWLVAVLARRDSPPTIALTRRTDPSTRVLALQHGADDVLSVPFAPDELVARAKALIRRGHRTLPTPTPVLHVGDLQIDLLRRKTTLIGVELDLTPVEQSLLYLLAANAGRVLSRDVILNWLWGADYISDSNIVDRHIRNLRSKLQDSWRHPRFIVTVARQGYRFESGVRPEPHSSRESGHAGSDHSPPLRLASGTREARGRQPDEPPYIHRDWYVATRAAPRQRHRLRHGLTTRRGRRADG